LQDKNTLFAGEMRMDLTIKAHQINHQSPPVVTIKAHQINHQSPLAMTIKGH
jgi:hypothetical protein